MVLIGYSFIIKTISQYPPGSPLCLGHCLAALYAKRTHLFISFVLRPIAVEQTPISIPHHSLTLLHILLKLSNITISILKLFFALPMLHAC